MAPYTGVYGNTILSTHIDLLEVTNETLTQDGPDNNWITGKLGSKENIKSLFVNKGFLFVHTTNNELWVTHDPTSELWWGVGDNILHKIHTGIWCEAHFPDKKIKIPGHLEQGV